MSEGYASLDAHAYVDNSLTPVDRAAFEAAMRREPKLRARVDAWEAQNEAIRLAFGASPRPRVAPPLARPSNENNAKAPAARLAELTQRVRPSAKPRIEAPADRPATWPVAALGVAVFAVAMVGFCGGPEDPRAALRARAETALRVATAFPDVRLDFVSDDPFALSAWLSNRFARLDPDRLSAPGWSLLGARIAPGVSTSAALVIYEDALGGKAGLLLERTDGLPDLPPDASRDADRILVSGVENGVGYAAVGPRRSGVGALVPVQLEE